MDTYEEYLDHKAGHILAIEEAQSIYKRMTDAIAKCEHEAKKELWDDFLQTRKAWTFPGERIWETKEKELVILPAL